MKVKVAKFQTITFTNAFARFAGDGVPGNELSFFLKAKAVVPVEDGGPEYHPLEANEVEALKKLAADDPKFAGITRRAHFKRGLMLLQRHGLRKFSAPNDLVLYVGDDEPEVTDGPHPAVFAIELAFGSDSFTDTEEIEDNRDTQGITTALMMAGLGLDRDSGPEQLLQALLGGGGPRRHEMDFNDDSEVAIVAKTTFTNGSFGLVEDGGAGMSVYAQLRIMHEPGTKPEYRVLTDEEREHFSEMTDGKFVPVASYIFELAGYMHPTPNPGQQELHLGRVPVMVDSEAAQVIEGYTWAPKYPFDQIGVTNYLGVKKGSPTPDEISAVNKMTANSRYHDGKVATVN